MTSIIYINAHTHTHIGLSPKSREDTMLRKVHAKAQRDHEEAVILVKANQLEESTEPEGGKADTSNKLDVDKSDASNNASNAAANTADATGSAKVKFLSDGFDDDDEDDDDECEEEDEDNKDFQNVQDTQDNKDTDNEDIEDTEPAPMGSSLSVKIAGSSNSLKSLKSQDSNGSAEDNDDIADFQGLSRWVHDISLIYQWC